jgi:phosphoglycolate phosphatase
LPNLDLVILDLDGTLYSSTATTLGAVERAVRELNDRRGLDLAVPGEDQILGGVGSTRKEFTAKVFPALPAEHHDEMDDLIWHWEQELVDRGMGSLFPGARDALEGLSSNGLRLAVATNAGSGYMNHILDFFEIRPYFADVRCAGEEQSRNKSELIDKVLATLSVRPRDAAMVGDRDSDIEAAHSACTWAIGCTWGFGTGAELRDAHKVVGSFRELVELLRTWP